MISCQSDTTLDTLRSRLQAGLSPDLLHKDYRSNWSPDNPTYGFCSVAAEVAWFMLGGRDAGWVVWSARDSDNTTHWWLRHASGKIFDPTVEQYTSQDKTPPYKRGIPGQPGRFMGIRLDEQTLRPGQRRPSARARALMAAIGVRQGEQACEPPNRRPRP